MNGAQGHCQLCLVDSELSPFPAWDVMLTCPFGGCTRSAAAQKALSARDSQRCLSARSFVVVVGGPVSGCCCERAVMNGGYTAAAVSGSW